MHSESGNLWVHGGLAEVLGAFYVIAVILCDYSCAHVLCITVCNDIDMC